MSTPSGKPFEAGTRHWDDLGSTDTIGLLFRYNKLWKKPKETGDFMVVLVGFDGIYPLVSSNVAGWKIPELDGDF